MKLNHFRYLFYSKHQIGPIPYVLVHVLESILDNS